MLLSSNGRTPVFQTDVDAGSIPVKSTTRPCRLRWLGHHPLKVKKADRHRSGLQKYLVILKYYLIFVKQRRSVRLAGLGHLPFTEKITGSNHVRTTILEGG